MRMRKGPPPYVGMGPRMVNPALGIFTALSLFCSKAENQLKFSHGIRSRDWSLFSEHR